MLETIIKNRRAVFPPQYNDKPISKEAILKILEAANWAPTHRKTEPWRFKIMHGESQAALGVFLADKYKETAKFFSEFKYENIKNYPKKSGCVIAVCMQRDPKESLPEWEEIAAVAMAVQNMWLMCTDLGIGAYLSTPNLVKYFHEFHALNEGERCLGFFYMGHYDQALPAWDRSPIEDKTHWI